MVGSDVDVRIRDLKVEVLPVSALSRMPAIRVRIRRSRSARSQPRSSASAGPIQF